MTRPQRQPWNLRFRNLRSQKSRRRLQTRRSPLKFTRAAHRRRQLQPRKLLRRRQKPWQRQKFSKRVPVRRKIQRSRSRFPLHRPQEEQTTWRRENRKRHKRGPAGERSARPEVRNPRQRRLPRNRKKLMFLKI